MLKNITLLLILLGTNPLVTAQEEVTLKGNELFGDMRARHIGPALMSGRINDLETHPTNPRIIYAGTAGGGVWKSDDGGATFNPIFDKYAQSIGVVTLDPNDPDQTIWVGTGETWTRNSVSIGDGLYKSTDGGTNWKEIPGFENSERIASIVINPNNSNEIYVGVLGALWSDSEDRGVYKTTDNGKSWEKILYFNESTGAADILMDPKDPNILYASMWEFRRTPWGFNSGGKSSALYKTLDGGKTWNKIHNGFPEGKLGRIAIALAPSDNDRLYAVLETEQPSKNGLWKSTDAGKNWEHTNNDFGLVVRPFYFSRIVVDPKNPDIVIKGGLSGSISRDGGKTFKNLGQMHSDIHDVAFHINDSDIIYAGTDGGVYRSWNGATTFEIVENLPLSQFYHISIDDAEPYNVYGGLQDNGSWYGPSLATGGIKARDWNSIGYGDGFRVLKHPTKNIIYSEMQGAENVWRYDVDRKRTKTIQPLQKKGEPDLRFNWNAPMAISNHVPDRFYMGSQFLHRSDDMGDNWKTISPDLTTNDSAKQNQSNSGGLSVDNSGAENHTTIFTIAESPLDENIIWVGTDDGNIQVTKDGGQSWEDVTQNLNGIPANTWVYHIEASVHAKGKAYAVFDGHTTGNMQPYALKTDDFGKTWKSIVSKDIQENAFVRNLQEDYENENLLFLGTELGLYVTIDGGNNWSHFTNNVPPVAIHFMDLHKQSSDLVMGTHGRGVIIIDDISPLRELNQEILQKDVHFFNNEPIVMKETSGFSGNFGSETQFIGENKPSSARITYYLKKRHTFGKMSMEVQDLDGNKIVELNPGKSKGINLVNWDFNKKTPKMAEGKTMTFGGFTAPRVPAGQYKIVLQKGKDKFEHQIELKYDDSALTKLSDRQDQEKMTQTLFDMVEELAFMVYEINEIQDKAVDIIAIEREKLNNMVTLQLKEKLSKEENQKLKDLEKSAMKNKKAYEVFVSLEKLRKDLVVTTGDNYVASADPELRERMGELYSNVASNYDQISGSHKQNYTLISEEFEASKVRFEKISKNEVMDFMKYLEKNEIDRPEIKTKEKFLSK